MQQHSGRLSCGSVDVRTLVALERDRFDPLSEPLEGPAADVRHDLGAPAEMIWFVGVREEHLCNGRSGERRTPSSRSP
jgi:hypothetical protein